MTFAAVNVILASAADHDVVALFTLKLVVAIAALQIVVAVTTLQIACGSALRPADLGAKGAGLAWRGAHLVQWIKDLRE